MITTVIADGKKEYEFIEFLKQRAQSSDKNVIPVVSEILENVRTGGDAAVRDYTIKFDGKAPAHAEISADEIDALLRESDHMECLLSLTRYIIIVSTACVNRLQSVSAGDIIHLK